MQDVFRQSIPDFGIYAHESMRDREPYMRRYLEL
jgi:hypothetical protein